MRSRGFPFLPLLLLLPACGDDQAARFSEPKTLPAAQRPTTWDSTPKDRLLLQDMARPGAGQAGGAVAWTATTPAGWESLPPQPQRFRDLIWRVAGDASTEIYLTGRVGGGVQQNVRRWVVDQMGRTEVPAVESLPLIELGTKPARLLELTGTFQGKPDQAMLVAFTTEGDGMTTLKFNGPAATVAAHKDAFLLVAKSLRQQPAGAAGAGSAQPGPVDPNQPLPDGHPPMGNEPPAPHAAPAAPFTATVPAGWTPKAGGNKPLQHTFGTDGEVYVSQLGGTVRPMLDIWRGEVGLAAATDAEAAALPKLPMLGGEGVLLDVSGDYHHMSGKQIAGARSLVAVTADGNTIVFAKMVGRADEVAAQVAAFQAFCASLRRAP